MRMDEEDRCAVVAVDSWMDRFARSQDRGSRSQNRGSLEGSEVAINQLCTGLFVDFIVRDEARAARRAAGKRAALDTKTRTSRSASASQQATSARVGFQFSPPGRFDPPLSRRSTSEGDRRPATGRAPWNRGSSRGASRGCASRSSCGSRGGTCGQQCGSRQANRHKPSRCTRFSETVGLGLGQTSFYKWVPKGREDIVGVLQREELTSYFSKDINRFWGLRHSRPREDLTGTFVRHVRELMEYVRRAKRLVLEVNTFFDADLSANILATQPSVTDRKSAQNIEGRQARLRDFFTLYHQTGNKLDCRAEEVQLDGHQLEKRAALDTKHNKRNSPIGVQMLKGVETELRGSLGPGAESLMQVTGTRPTQLGSGAEVENITPLNDSKANATRGFARTDKAWKLRGARENNRQQRSTRTNALRESHAVIAEKQKQVRANMKAAANAFHIAGSLRRRRTMRPTMPESDDDESNHEEVDDLEGQACMSSTGSRANGSTSKPGCWRLRTRARAEVYTSNATQASVTSLGQKSFSLPNLRNCQLPPSFPKARDDSNAGTTCQLPPLPTQFTRPWQESDSQPKRNLAATRYIHACERSWLVPTLIPFLTGHSLGLGAKGKGLCDGDILAIVEMIPTARQIKEIDLEDNGYLTEKSVVPLLQKLFGKPASTSLERLCLKGCLRHATLRGAHASMDVVVQLLTESRGIHRLSHLDLSGITMPMVCHVPLCQAVREHPSLTEVFLAGIGLQGRIAKKCVAKLMGSSTVKALDLGWNSFSADVFQELGVRLVETNMLKSLSLANCTSSSESSDSPITLFIESLAHDSSLTFLNVSMNRIGFAGALVLEDACHMHQQLTEVDVSHNMLSVLGMRSILRLLSRQESGLIRFACEGCSGSDFNEVARENNQILNTHQPGNRYALDLARPYHRALLRMLYKTSEGLGLAPQDAFSDVAYSKSTYKHPMKDAKGIFKIPMEGKLTATFSIDLAVAAAMKDVDMWSFKEFLEMHGQMVKVAPGFRKVVPLLAQWKRIHGLQGEQLLFLDALAKDFQFTYPHLTVLCKAKELVCAIISRLLPSITGGPLGRYLSIRLMPTANDYVVLMRSARKLLSFNAENPTGHYRLDLAVRSDYAVAEQILLLDRWECTVAGQLGRIDVSQRGNYSHIRNEKFNNRSLFFVHSLAEWRLPESDLLEFDYSSGKRPPFDAVELDEETLASIALKLQLSTCDWTDQVEAYRTVSHLLYLTSTQLRSLIGIFRRDDERQEICVASFFRLVDMHNEKVFRVRFERDEELKNLEVRLGAMPFFPYMQPEQANFVFDCAIHDERCAASVLLNIVAREGYYNMSEPFFVLADGTFDPLESGVPHSWEIFEKMPTTGTFHCSYRCAPEKRSFQERQRCLEMYGFWQAPATEAEVMWCANIAKAPPDVLEYIEFLAARFSDLSEAFRVIDGEDGNGEITLREFEEGIKKMKCMKFKGPRETQRIHSVFRYLDPGGEGSISEYEWGILDLLLKEIRLSISEFVFFLERTFGIDLENAWRSLDADGSGEITHEEWEETLESVGFFGQSRPIFCFLDKNDEGTIALDEFLALKSFRSSRGVV